jgi:hypothetical protein
LNHLPLLFKPFKITQPSCNSNVLDAARNSGSFAMSPIERIPRLVTSAGDAAL